MARKTAGVKHGKHDKGSSHASGPANDGIRHKIQESRRKHESTVKFNSTILWTVIAAIILLVAVGAYFWYASMLQNMVRTPLDVPKVVSADDTSSVVDPERFWGTYRSGLYFGMKTRSPHSPVVGLMWMTQFTGQSMPSIRHACDQADGFQTYGWLAHDGVNFGMQEIVDQYFTLSTNFVKRAGGQHGGDWSAKIRITPKPGGEKVVVSLFVYMASDGHGQVAANLANGRVAAIRGRSEDLGSFQLVFPKLDKTIKYHYMVGYIPSLDKAKDAVIDGLKYYQVATDSEAKFAGLMGLKLPDGMPESQANLIVSQVTVNIPYEVEVAFESDSVVNRRERLVGQTFFEEISKHLSAFDERFEAVFSLREKGYDDDRRAFAKAALSNLLGGISYFYGSSLVQSRYVAAPIKYWEAALYTAVPSRSFFPRGFLWDEGFHNILISRWDLRISMDIIGHWFDLMNIEGWIPREQILGLEARSRVPFEFVVQHNENANPPTMFLPLKNIVKELVSRGDPESHLYLEKIYPRLKVWYKWFNTTQAGSAFSAYRWRGRNATTVKELNPKTLTSGLDDYPRASHPTDDERHLDLRCWMALASNVMAEIAKNVNDTTTYEEYRRQYEKLTDNKDLDGLHWSEKTQRYSDYGLHTDHVKLERPPTPKNLQPGQRPPPNQQKDKERVVKREPVYQFIDSEFGYVSLFPFLLKIVDPDSVKLGKILQDLMDPNLLWTPYGLRSLAKSSPLYNKHNTEHDPPYWRGAIWININYLTIGALHHYANAVGPYREKASEVYAELRANVVENMFNQYRASGYIWEQYDDVTGKGKGSHPFTGWSALVVSIMAEQY